MTNEGAGRLRYSIDCACGRPIVFTPPVRQIVLACPCGRETTITNMEAAPAGDPFERFDR